MFDARSVQNFTDCRATLRSPFPRDLALEVDHADRSLVIVVDGECRIDLGPRGPLRRLAPSDTSEVLRSGDIAVILREILFIVAPPDSRRIESFRALLDADAGEWREVRAPYGQVPEMELVLAAFPNMNPVLARLCGQLPELIVIRRDTALGTRCDWLRRTLVRSADRAEPGGGYVRSHLARLLLREILRAHLRDVIPLVRSWDRLLADSEVATACLAMLERLDQDWTVDRLTRETQVPRCTLARRFQRVVGRSPAEWLRSVRLARAAEWLRSRAGSIESIARRAGYQSASGFRAAYHRATGTSPSESRE